MITEAARGQDTAHAAALAREGARVIAADAAPQPDCRLLDVTAAQGWAALAADLRATHGAVHGPANCAGITWRARLSEATPEDFAWVLGSAGNVGRPVARCGVPGGRRLTDPLGAITRPERSVEGTSSATEPRGNLSAHTSPRRETGGDSYA
ncbi:hypothetical protein ACFV0T_41660 [Streptomyces sp. NPDC059582]|uniref:hypothetical protein n=1 Tax=Streptomyces sp. NPDC059582 TaxID=3346875 RepID=UPI0036CBF397